VAKYKILVSASAEKVLKGLPKKDLAKVAITVQSLASDPFPLGCRKLAGEKNVFRLRQGSYRIIYEVFKSELIIHILKVGHRKDVYRGI